LPAETSRDICFFEAEDKYVNIHTHVSIGHYNGHEQSGEGFESRIDGYKMTFYFLPNSPNFRVQSVPMRLLLVIICSVAVFSLKAQTPYAPMHRNAWQPGLLGQYHIMPDSNSLSKKWSVSKYGGISAGFLFSRGMSANFVAAPVGLQLNRRLTNNLYAFTGVSVAPTYFNFNSPFINPTVGKNYPGSMFGNSYQFAMGTRAELGLMYMNDQRTFSISGSVGVQRNSYPFYPVGSARQQPKYVMPSRQ